MRPRLRDGRDLLGDIVERAGYPTTTHALAMHTVFLHPDTVLATDGKPVFRVVRGASNAERGTVHVLSDGLPGLLDDNTAPTDAFLWAADHSRGRDLQVNHLWSRSDDVRYYTALWNICITPAFLAKLTDVDGDAKAALRWRAYDLYGFVPDGSAVPERPNGFEMLSWHPLPRPVRDLEGTLRTRLHRAPKSRTAKSARECGWLFSDFHPDSTL